MTRTILTADATYYVNVVTGSDSNDGLSSATAFKSIGHFIDVVAGKLDLVAFYRVTCHVAPGTYRENLITPNLLGFTMAFGYGQVTITATDPVPANTKIDGAGGYGILSQNTTMPITFAGFQFVNCSVAVYGDSAGLVALDGCDFAAASGSHIQSIYDSRIVLINRDYTISGPAPVHCSVAEKSLIFIQPGHTVTITGNPQFTYFMQARQASVLNAAVTTYVGTARGMRFKCSEGGIISTETGDINHLPGDLPGSTAGSGLQTPGSYS